MISRSRDCASHRSSLQRSGWGRAFGQIVLCIVAASCVDLWQPRPLGAEKLTADHRQTPLPGLVESSSQRLDWDFHKLQRSLTEMQKSNLPEEAQRALAAAWLKGRDLKTLSDPGQVRLLYRILNRTEQRAKHFSVCWTGFVRAPCNGTYKFFVNPININCDESNQNGRQRMVVSVAGQQIFDAGANGAWPSQGQAVSLKAGEKAALRVEFSYRCSETSIPWRFPAIAQLSWQGPGITKQLVPNNVLWSPDAATAGLAAEYRWMVDGQQKTTVRTEPVIDHVWVGDSSIVSAYPEACANLAARLAVMATAPDYLAELEANPDKKHFLLSDSSPISQMWMLSSSRHVPFVEELLVRPALLKPVSREAIIRLYQTCRFGCPDAALHVLGKWLQMHPETEPEFSPDAQNTTCMDYWVAASSMACQYPPHLNLLEHDYLALSDGGCCLPAAYILATGYSTKGRIGEWIEKLESKLKDEKLEGDRRVGWLLALGWAEEIRDAVATAHHVPIHHFLAGRGWLEEACLIAKSEPVRLRAYKELAVRLTGDEEFDAAKRLLERVGNRCSSPASIESLAKWQQEIDHVDRGNTQMQATREVVAQQAYWNNIRARYRAAVRTGDQDEVSRYKQAFSKAGVAP